MPTLNYKIVAPRGQVTPEQQKEIDAVLQAYEEAGITMQKGSKYQAPILCLNVYAPTIHWNFGHTCGCINLCPPKIALDLLKGHRTWYQATLIDLCEDRPEAIKTIASAVSSILMPMYDRMERERGEDGYKRAHKGSFDTFEEYWASEESEWDWEDCEDPEDPEDEWRKECAQAWEETRTRWLRDSAVTRTKIGEILAVLEELAEKFEIPFSAEMVKAQARAFAADHPKWDISTC